MLIKLKRTRTHDEDRNLAMWLATAAGVLNAIALGAFGFFPSHMSGNTSQLSSEVSNVNFRDITFLATILFAFVCGAVTARMVVISGLANGNRIIFCHILWVEGLALIGLSLFEMFFYSSANNREIIVILGFLMGVHNSTSTQLSNGRVRSTHITGTLTDAGISLASVLAALFRRDPSKNVSGQKRQLWTHLTTIFSFLIGGIVGLMMFEHLGFKAMAMVGGILVIVATIAMVRTVVHVNRNRSLALKPSSK